MSETLVQTMTRTQSIRPMQLLVSIVERGKGSDIIEYYKPFQLLYHSQASGRGTAASHLLDIFGFGTAERDIVLTFGARDAVQQLIYHLKDEDRSKLNIQGIAFSLRLSGMSAIMAICLSRIDDMAAERREDIMLEQRNPHSLILVTVNQGYVDAVMETAKAAGAKGGTIIRARGVGEGEIQKLAGITLQSEKEMLMIVAQNEERNAIMEEIDRVHGLRSPAQAMVVSMPIDYTARLN